MKLFALLALIASLALVGCQPSGTDSTTTEGSTTPPAADTNTPPPATK